MNQCPYCRGSVSPGAERCTWCNASLAVEPVQVREGDRIRIRNIFKGYHEEEVTVVRVLDGGWKLEVRDQGGLTWGYIKPADVLQVVKPARSRK